MATIDTARVAELTDHHVNVVLVSADDAFGPHIQLNSRRVFVRLFLTRDDMQRTRQWLNDMLMRRDTK